MLRAAKVRRARGYVLVTTPLMAKSTLKQSGGRM